MCLNESLTSAFETIREHAIFDSHSLVPHPDNLKFQATEERSAMHRLGSKLAEIVGNSDSEDLQYAAHVVKRHFWNELGLSQPPELATEVPRFLLKPGACGIHVFAAVMVLFDLAKSVALQDMPKRKYGVPSEVWKAFSHTFFAGVHAHEFVTLVDSLKLPLNLTLRESKEGGLDRWVVDCLMRGELVAIVTANARNSKFKHWSLALGIEGLMAGRETKPDTILLLDPSASEPSYRPHNARLRVPITGPGSRAGKSADELSQSPKSKTTSKPIHWLYESGDFATEQVRLVSAVRFRYADWS